MRVFTLRAGRAPLAILATALIALTTVTACAGDQPITAPKARPNTPSVGVRDVTTLPADSTQVTYTINRQGEFYDNGYGGISATFTCSRPLNESFVVNVTLQQNQRDVGLVESSSSYNHNCAQEGQSFDYFFAPLSAARSFERGRATAIISVVGVSNAVMRSTVSRSVRLVYFLDN